MLHSVHQHDSVTDMALMWSEMRVGSGRRWRSTSTSTTAHTCGSTPPTDGPEFDWSVAEKPFWQFFCEQN